MKKFTICFLFTFIVSIASAQNATTIDTSTISTSKNIKFNYKQLIIPSFLIGYGVVGLESDGIKGWNLGIRGEVLEDIDKKFTIDDFLQYTPAVSVYALNTMGVRGKNNLKDRTVILGTSMLLMATSVYALKHITNVKRPDGSDNHSFPSGHTALSFAGAEFLYQEYKDVSVWYGVSGYVVAIATGVFRIYNNKHWLTDVATGAGIGILSTKAAYWLSPILNRHIFPSMTGKTTAMFAPSYDGKHIGGAFVMTF